MIPKEIIEVVSCLSRIKDEERRLKEIGVLRTNADITAQLGEWVCEKIYNGKRAKVNQKGHDVTVGDKTIQVKTDRKDEENGWKGIFSISEKKLGQADLFCFVSFNKSRKIKGIYTLTVNEVKKNGKPYYDKEGLMYELNCKNLSCYEVKNSDLVDYLKTWR